MRERLKLYRVKLRGGSSSMSTNYSLSYVVAASPTMAYRSVRAYLDKEDLCFQHDRALSTIELVAEEGPYPECRTLLFIEAPHE